MQNHNYDIAAMTNQKLASVGVQPVSTVLDNLIRARNFVGEIGYLASMLSDKLYGPKPTPEAAQQNSPPDPVRLSDVSANIAAKAESVAMDLRRLLDAL